MASSNQNRLGTFIIVSLRIFIIIIFIGRWFINSTQDQIMMLRGFIDDVDEILSGFPGNKGVRILVLLPNGRLEDGNTYPTPYFFTQYR